MKLQIKQIKLINEYVICSQNKAFLKGFKSFWREISSNIDPDHSYRPRKNFPRMIPITTPVRKISQNDPDHGTISREISPKVIPITAPFRKISQNDPDHGSISRENLSKDGTVMNTNYTHRKLRITTAAKEKVIRISWGSSVWKADSCQGKISQNPPQLFYFHWKEKLQEATWELITANLSQIILSSWDAILSLGAPAHFSSLIFN